MRCSEISQVLSNLLRKYHKNKNKNNNNLILINSATSSLWLHLLKYKSPNHKTLASNLKMTSAKCSSQNKKTTSTWSTVNLSTMITSWVKDSNHKKLIASMSIPVLSRNKKTRMKFKVKSQPNPLSKLEEKSWREAERLKGKEKLKC